MGFFGILFERENNAPLLIFTDNEKCSSIQIVGFKSTLPETYDIKYIHSNGIEGKFFLFEHDPKVYSKIAVNDITIIDFQYKSFWFNPNSYKILRDLLYIRKQDLTDYYLRFNDVLGYF